MTDDGYDERVDLFIEREEAKNGSCAICEYHPYYSNYGFIGYVGIHQMATITKPFEGEEVEIEAEVCPFCNKIIDVLNQEAAIRMKDLSFMANIKVEASEEEHHWRY